MLEYPGEEQFQIEGGTVTARSRPPRGDERFLQYWRHRWRGEAQQERDTPGDAPAHGARDRQLINSVRRATVIFSSQDGRVLRVIQYGQNSP